MNKKTVQREQIGNKDTLREESSQTNVILQYKLLAAIVSAVCSVIQQSQYVLHFIYVGKYDCKITTHQTIFQLQCFVLLNNHQYNCNITKSFLGVAHSPLGILSRHEKCTTTILTNIMVLLSHNNIPYNICTQRNRLHCIWPIS